MVQFGKGLKPNSAVWATLRAEVFKAGGDMIVIGAWRKEAVGRLGTLKASGLDDRILS